MNRIREANKQIQFMRLECFLFIGCVLLAFSADAQNGSVSIQPVYDKPAVKADETGAGDFCKMIMKLAGDAPGNFTKTKGKEIEVHTEASIYSCNMALPGMVTSALIFTGSWQYEGIVYQGNSIEDMRIYYDKYKKLLDGCAAAQGYSLVDQQANADAKLNNYPGLYYRKPSKEGPFISMNVYYADNTGTYTLSVNVWQGKK